VRRSCAVWHEAKGGGGGGGGRRVGASLEVAATGRRRGAPIRKSTDSTAGHRGIKRSAVAIATPPERGWGIRIAIAPVGGPVALHNARSRKGGLVDESAAIAAVAAVVT